MSNFRILAVLVLTLLLWSELANAQQPFRNSIRFQNSAITDTAYTAAVILKSKKVAFRRSLWHTLAPVASAFVISRLTEGNTIEAPVAALLGYGLMVGPSMGNLYAEDWSRGINGFVFRGLGVGAVILAGSLGDDVIDYTPIGGYDRHDWHDPLTESEFVRLVGTAIYIGGVLYNFLTLNRSVDEYSHDLKKGVRIEVSPSYDIKTGTPLLSTHIRF